MRSLVVLVVVAGCGDNLNAPDAVVPVPNPVFAQTAYVKSTQPIHDAHFGKSALSGSANTLVATQPGAVSVYVNDGTWRVAGEIVPLTSSEGYSSVAMSNDGSTIAVADVFSGVTVCCSVYVFRKVGTDWIQDARIADDMATALALSSDGNTLVLGSQNASTGVGRVRTYKRGQDTWSLVASLGGAPDDSNFGMSLALAQDASVLAARAYDLGLNDYVVEVFVRSGDTWLHRATLTSPDQLPSSELGASISCSAQCETIVSGAPQPPPPLLQPGMQGAGVAHVFAADGATWTPIATLAASNADIGDNFGIAVAISGDGSTIVVGAPSESSASTGIDGNGLDNAAPYAGAAYVFRRHLGAWTEVMYLKASNAATIDTFGAVVGVSNDGTTIVVAAPNENSGSSGIDGDQTDESQPYAGAIYVFEGTY